MDANEANQLRQRIEAYSFDAPDATYPFAAKLADEQAWPLDFAQRAIAEYRRFAFLAVAAGHPVSPSPIVDEVWHCHLLYTYTYWKEFCPKVLGRDLHHHPSIGGDDAARYRKQYEQTLASYEHWFSEMPPPDLWPSGEASRPASSLTVVDRRRHWIIRKPKWLALAVVPFLSGCESGAVFDLNGPDFLGFFGGLMVVAFVAMVVLRSKWLHGSDDPASLPNLDPVAMAFLNEGPVLAINTAVAGLVHEGVLTVSADGKVTSTGILTEARDPISQRICQLLGSRGSESLPKLRNVLRDEVDQLRAQLQDSGLVPNADQESLIRWVPFSVGSAVTLLGIVKIAVGVSRDRPVGFLVLMSLISLFCTLMFLSVPRATKKGREVLEAERHKFARLRKPGRDAIALHRNDLMLGVGLFGLGNLVGSQYDGMRQSLQPAPGSPSGCGGGCSGGGDGGGGGGCGGCGGGGD